jgi:hypothetical protein
MERSKSPIRRCAIYTRKSSEEGLEQDFNSLHAQREACEAFIQSQAGEGWRLILRRRRRGVYPAAQSEPGRACGAQPRRCYDSVRRSEDSETYKTISMGHRDCTARWRADYRSGST